MPFSEIGKRFTFYGLLPPGSIKSHLAVILNEKNELVKYCYCTSVFNQALLRYTESDCFILRKEDMVVYFPNSNKETYIYLSEEKIINITLAVLKLKLANGEYEQRIPLANDVFSDLVEAIKMSDNLSDRFKNEILEFLE
jgi:hypothetical protein